MTAELSLEITPPSAENTALVVITYNPDASFIERISTAAAMFPKVVLVDNSESEQSDFQRLDQEKFELTCNRENIGLANALNIACARAAALGFDWVVTLDQDTGLYPGFLQGMMDAWMGSSSVTALLGSNYYNVSRSIYRVPPTDLPQADLKTTVITSGCLTYLPVWSALGEFRGDYFIDAIDHEFCLRVRQAGFTVAINCQVGMEHVIGNQLEYGAAIARLAPYRHSVWRKYTGTRNSLRTVMDYATREPVWCVRKILGMLAELITIVVLEPEKKIRLRAFFTGLRDGYQGRLGPVPDEFKSA
ncbi:MAG: glycosyltransferase [Halioglobus sp.]